MTYRGDIDGLRGIAVLSVLAYHIMPRALPGGFVGVDVFFVISGYLITSIIWSQCKAGTFSFATFYAKRIRRLFPALFAVIFACSTFQYFIGFPQEIYDFGVSSIAAIFYFSNHYFLSKSGYFDDAVESNPLLHTWSLGVEEQFYILFPALLVFLFYKARDKGVLVLSILLVLSLFLSEILLVSKASSSFYLVVSRFWEFLIGGILSLKSKENAIRRPHMEIIGWIGLGMLVFSFLNYSEHVSFPGLNALVPALGTFLLLYVGQHKDQLITRCLSLSPIRNIGKLSYSLYLWHWPIIVFYKLEFSPDPSSIERIVLILVCMGVAYLSWRFIEQPFLKLQIKDNRKLIYISGGVASIFLLFISIYFVYTEGIKERFSDKQLAYIEYLNYDADPYLRTDQCFLTSNTGSAKSFDERACLNSDSDRPSVLIIGDSHAAHYHAALSKSFSEYSISQVSASGCRPLISYAGEERCTALMKKTFELYIKKYDFDAIILAGRWERKDFPALKPTVSAISAFTKNVIVLGPIIEYNQALPRLLARNMVQSKKVEEAQQYKEIENIDREMAALVGKSEADYISILNTMCPGEKCLVYTTDGVPMQFDSSHLTMEGAMELVSLLIERGFLKNLVTRSNVDQL